MIGANWTDTDFFKGLLTSSNSLMPRFKLCKRFADVFAKTLWPTLAFDEARVDEHICRQVMQAFELCLVCEEGQITRCPSICVEQVYLRTE